MRRKTVEGPAPSEVAACSASRSRSSSTGCTVRTVNGSVTKSNAMKSAARLPNRLGPTPSVPYTASITTPATIVGRANGMSMTISKIAAPRGRSRTSTQATSVPIAPLTSATARESPIVSLSASAVTDDVIADQKSSQPEPKALPTTAASGSRTSRLSQMTITPSVVPDAAPSGRPVCARLRAGFERVPAGAGTLSTVAVIVSSTRSSSRCRCHRRTCR